MENRKVSCSYAHVKAYGGVKVQEANWMFGEVDQRLSSTTMWNLINTWIISGLSSNDLRLCVSDGC